MNTIYNQTVGVCWKNFNSMGSYEKASTIGKAIGVAIVCGIIGSRFGHGPVSAVVGGVSAFAYMTYNRPFTAGLANLNANMQMDNELRETGRVLSNAGWDLRDSFDDLTNCLKGYYRRVSSSLSRSTPVSTDSIRRAAGSQARSPGSRPNVTRIN